MRRSAHAVGAHVTGSSPILHPDDDPRFEIALQLASRFWQLVKSGRAYSVGHVTYTTQLESYITLLSTALEKDGAVRFDASDGALCMNGELLPDRAHMQKALESLVQEFGARTLEGIEFTRGITLGELETFMSYFLPGERWKGAELVAACDDAGLVHARALPLRVAAEPLGVALLGESSQEAADTPPAWRALLSGARALLEGDAMDLGLELRHVKRMLRPLIDAVLAGERLVALLAEVPPRESAWSHAAHTTLLTLCVGARLGLSRHELADLAVAALLHDAGHGWGEAGGPEMVEEHREPAPHTREGLRRVAWSTTLNRTSLGAMRAALEHHLPTLGETGECLPFSLLSQIVSMCDAYTTLLSRGDKLESRLSPSSALVRVIGPFRDRWHPALPPALVRVLGVHPPGQYVELDDGSIARAVGPDPDDPERPWIERVVDTRGVPILPGQRQAAPLPTQHFVARALPREEWPRKLTRRPAA